VELQKLKLSDTEFKITIIAEFSEVEDKKGDFSRELQVIKKKASYKIFNANSRTR
jgi:hypothetical protein